MRLLSATCGPAVFQSGILPYLVELSYQRNVWLSMSHIFNNLTEVWRPYQQECRMFQGQKVHSGAVERRSILHLTGRLYFGAVLSFTHWLRGMPNPFAKGLCVLYGIRPACESFQTVSSCRGGIGTFERYRVERDQKHFRGWQARPSVR